MQTDYRLVQTTPKDGARRAGRRQLSAQRGTMVTGGGAEEGKNNRTGNLVWPFGKATLGAQQIGTQRGAMIDEVGAGEEEVSN